MMEKVMYVWPRFGSRSSGLAVVMLLAGVLARPIHGQEVLIESDEVWKYFKGSVAPSNPATAWRELDFDDDTWLEGATGIGYGDGDDATVLSDMEDSYMSVFCRKIFTIDDPADVDSLGLLIDWDDGFAAYINGVEVARSSLAQNAAFNTAATPLHERVGTLTPFDVSAAVPELVAGDNVLAVQVHNGNLSSSDLTFIPRLVANDSGLLCPRGLTCTTSAGAVALSWTNSAVYDEIQVIRNGLSVPGSPFAGTITSFNDTSPVAGLDNVYEVVAVIDGEPCDPIACSSTCGDAGEGNLQCALELVDGFTQATLSWDAIPDVVGVEILREGAPLDTLDPGATMFVDLDVESLQAEQDTDYDVVLTDADGNTCTMECGPLSLCPQLTIEVVDVDGEDRIRLTWDNLVKAWDDFTIRRDGVVIGSGIDPAEGEFIDTELAPGQGVSYDYTLDPLGGLVDCSVDVTFRVPEMELGVYEPPAGGWDYELDLAELDELDYNPVAGEDGNLDGEWIRDLSVDFWDGSAPLETGIDPTGLAPGGIGLVTIGAGGICGEDIPALQILDPGDPSNPGTSSLAAAFPNPYNDPSNRQIFLGLDLQAADVNLLRSGLTFLVRFRISPNAPSYMNASATGDGEPLSGGRGLVGVYFSNDGSLPTEGASAACAFALNSSNGGEIQFSTEPATTLTNAGVLNFRSFWVTIEDPEADESYDVNVYSNGETVPFSFFSGAAQTLQAGVVNFGPGPGNYLAIGLTIDSNDGIAEIATLAVKEGVHSPQVAPCGGGSEDDFVRGDVDGNGLLELADPVFDLVHQFLGGDLPRCFDAADLDDNGLIELADPIFNLVHQFAGGDPPPAPGPLNCGPDPSADAFPPCVSNCP